MLLVVVLFGVAPGFDGGLEAEAFLFHNGILASRLLKRKKAKKEKRVPKLDLLGVSAIGFDGKPPLRGVRQWGCFACGRGCDGFPPRFCSF